MMKIQTVEMKLMKKEESKKTIEKWRKIKVKNKTKIVKS